MAKGLAAGLGQTYPYMEGVIWDSMKGYVAQDWRESSANWGLREDPQRS